MNRWHLRLIVVPWLLAWSFSTLVHYPWGPYPGLWGIGYSDIVYGVFYERFTDTRYWYNVDVYGAILGGYSVCPIPYVDYYLEYPPIVGTAWLASVCIASVATQGFKGFERVVVMAQVHYIVQAVIILAGWLYVLWGLLKLRVYGGDPLLLAIMPSALLYLVYNWDVIASAFTIWSLFYLIKRKYLYAGLLLGMAFSTKVLPGAILFPLLVVVGGKSLLYGFVAGSIPYLVVSLLSPQGIADMVLQHAGWYCENCIYLPLTSSIFNPLNKMLAAVLIPLGLLVVAGAYRVPREPRDFIELYLAAMMFTLVFNYVFTPQMLLMLSPLALLALRGLKFKAYIVADTLNALIMVVFFNDELVRKVLGLEPVFSPWSIDSPVQWLAMARNTILLLILLLILYARLSTYITGERGSWSYFSTLSRITLANALRFDGAPDAAYSPLTNRDGVSSTGFLPNHFS